MEGLTSLTLWFLKNWCKPREGKVRRKKIFPQKEN